MDLQNLIIEKAWHSLMLIIKNWIVQTQEDNFAMIWAMIWALYPSRHYYGRHFLCQPIRIQVFVCTTEILANLPTREINQFTLTREKLNYSGSFPFLLVQVTVVDWFPWETFWPDLGGKDRTLHLLAQQISTIP